MTRDELRLHAKHELRIQDYLTASQGGLYCCPFCGSGNGIHGTGALKVYDDFPQRFYCHSCGKGGDVLDVIQEINDLPSYNAALHYAAELLGVSIDYPRSTAAEDFSPTPSEPATAPTERPQVSGDKTPAPADRAAERGAQLTYSEYYKVCNARISHPDAASYLSARGISVETARAYNIGYDPEWISPQVIAKLAAEGNAWRPPATPRLIIPISDTKYCARDTRSSIPPEQENYAKAKVGSGGGDCFFNLSSLYTQDVREVFITEGAFDALSLLEIGYPALALNGAQNVKRLITQLEERPTAAMLILALDADPAGRRAAETLRTELQRLNVSFVDAPQLSGSFKDPNEHLVANRDGFTAAARQVLAQTAPRPDNVSQYINTQMFEEIEQFRSVILTGYSNLDDKEAAGGLYAGLYVLAAISSLGKTTFAAQMADQIAEQGTDVLFFSLEQSRLELVTKSFARITAKADLATAVNSLSIRRGYLPENVRNAIAEYPRTVGERLSIIEGNFACDTRYICDYVRRYITSTGTKPVVFLDYLQILQPDPTADRKQTLRETVDSTVTTLKRLSRELGLTVIVISSVNRSNYLAPIDFESLKESGGIEYSADVVWGLQLQCLSEELFDKKDSIKAKRERVKEAKKETPRKIELVCLKNRYGKPSYSCYFDYYSGCDYFQPSGTPSTKPIRRV